MQTQIARNNRLTAALLLAFPCIILAMVWLFFALLEYLGSGGHSEYGEVVYGFDVDVVNDNFLAVLPLVVGGVGVWFAIAYFSNSAMVRAATGARPLERRENPKIYNMVENLCMACNMDMPKVNIVNDPQLNAFASGIDKGSYAVTLTTGIIDRLNDDELEGVIAHELTHIRNRDTRLLITSIVFVGIVSTVMGFVVRMLYHTLLFGGGSSRKSKEKDNGLGIVVVLLVAIVCCVIAYVFTLLTRFAISRKREYMADAGGAELSGKPWALASALRKISGDPGLNNVERDDIAQLFIVHPQQLTSGLQRFMISLFSTHPDTRKRIAVLEQF